MCSTCGCGAGQLRIEGIHQQEHSHDNIRRHGHHHGHDHHDHHDHHNNDHHNNDHHNYEHPELFSEVPTVIHHHYHHQGDVHHHYHYHLSAGAEAALSDAQSLQPEVSAQHLDYGRGEAGTHAPGISQKRMLQIETDVLSKNNQLAQRNRSHFADKNILVLNLVSSPGSGKTTLLTETLMRLRDRRACAVIEGDQQTANDAERIRATGVPAIQVNTGKGCHLDAQMIHDAAGRLELKPDSLLFIENVGNLVCPASFDLGERHKVAVLSVTEGEDKPLKYPHMFAAADLMLINKIDLLPYLQCDIEACIANARRVNPTIQVIKLSATSGEGMDAWIDWLETQLCV